MQQKNDVQKLELPQKLVLHEYENIDFYSMNDWTVKFFPYLKYYDHISYHMKLFPYALLY